MTTLTNPKNNARVTVPDAVADSYVSRGWVAPGAPALAEPVKKPRRRPASKKKPAEVVEQSEASEAS